MTKEKDIKKVERLNLMLLTLRNVSRILISENDPQKLIQGICEILVEKRGYYNAWIGLFNYDSSVKLIADAGSVEEFDQVRDAVKKNKFTRCIRYTMEERTVFSVNDPVRECSQCLLSGKYSNRGALAVRIEYKEMNYGFLVVSIPKELAGDETEKDILKEISNDIALGLYRLGLEEKRKITQEEIRRSRIRFKTLIENSLNCISIIQNDKTIYKNAGLRKIHVKMENVFEPPDFKRIYEADRPRVKALYRDLIENKINRIETDFRYIPIPAEKESSDVRWALLSATKIDYLEVKSILTNIMDITDSKEVEHLLQIQDKMTSLGRVTAGIAHEIRNPLSGIYIYLKALKKIYNEMGDISKVVSIIDKIELASNKIESIIKRVMDFSKPSHPQFVMADLNEYIDDVTKLTAVTLRKSGIRFEKHLDPDLPACFAEPHLIEQVILNLITNAAEAMKDFQGDKQIVLSTAAKENFVEICVSDTGPGVPLSSRSKIFDPFYTTKTNSSGIGLSICHRIILDHGGALRFKTSGNGGATFIIELPLQPIKG